MEQKAKVNKIVPKYPFQVPDLRANGLFAINFSQMLDKTNIFNFALIFKM